jgi:phosphoribosylaminoimidazole-succinocarboxamide synthase
MPELLHTAVFGLPPARIGKVREVIDVGDAVLIVATDRISAFDCVMANGIPDKGRLLTQMSKYWFESLADVCPHHLISVEFADIQARCPRPQPELEGRTTLAKKAKPLPVECVARGYLAGSLFKEYRSEGRKLHGLDLPAGLVNSQILPEPIFSPATKAESGHDENISFVGVENRIGKENAALVRDWTLELYKRAAARAAEVGLILADTKFEFGETEDGLIWIDEALTPDSSRYWDVERYAPGKSQPSFDKQYLRDWLETSGWNKMPPGPVLPPDVVAETGNKYREAYRRIVGHDLVS